MNRSTSMPAGVMRMVHPTRLRRVREAWGELEDPNWSVISGCEFYFTRCKKCARVLPGCSLRLDEQKKHCGLTTRLFLN